MSKPQNRITLDATLHELLVTSDDSITRFIARAERIGAGGRDEFIPCVAFGKQATFIARDLDVLDEGDAVRVKGGLRIEDGKACLIVDSVRPLYQRE